MSKKSIEVRLVNKIGNIYQIKFPHLKVPVEVNEHLYQKMLQSLEYRFISSNATVKQSYST